MKATPLALLTGQSRCACCKIERADGTTQHLTNHDKDLTFDGSNWLAGAGFRRTATRQSTAIGKQGLDLIGLISDTITEDDLSAGLYDGAEFWVFETSHLDPGTSKHKLEYGMLGKVTRQRGQFQVVFDTLSNLLGKTIGGKYGEMCQHTLGDSNCGIELRPATRADSEALALLDVRVLSTYDGRRYVCTTAGTTAGTEPSYDDTVGNTTTDGTAVLTCYDAYVKEGSVTGFTDRQVFIDTVRAADAVDLFAYGKITWTGGLNSGLSMHVKSSASDGTITLLAPMLFAIAVTDTYEIEVGCNLLLKMSGDEWGTDYTGDCRAKFNLEDGGNAAKFGAFPEITGNDQILRGPD